MSKVRVYNPYSVFNAGLLGAKCISLSVGTREAPFCFDDLNIPFLEVIAEAILHAGTRNSGTFCFSYNNEVTMLRLGCYFCLTPPKVYNLRDCFRHTEAVDTSVLRNGKFIGDVPGFGPLIFEMQTGT